LRLWAVPESTHKTVTSLVYRPPVGIRGESGLTGRHILGALTLSADWRQTGQQKHSRPGSHP
ncbi:MAG: hypothetical protein WCD34_10055, partial [Candidatus Acidiferrum sp.]